MIGQKFGYLTVISEGQRLKDRKSTWICRCDCGGVKQVIGSNLKSGHTKSCGCISKKTAPTRAIKHGMTGTKIHRVWIGMKSRCFCSTDKSFKDYGNRGITVCDEWKNDYQAFYDYVSQLPHFGEEGYSLDRINNDGNYEPDNVQWATKSQQALNRRKKNSVGV